MLRKQSGKKEGWYTDCDEMMGSKIVGNQSITSLIVEPF